jgi:hypothetical protein
MICATHREKNKNLRSTWRFRHEDLVETQLFIIVHEKNMDKKLSIPFENFKIYQ